MTYCIISFSWSIYLLCVILRTCEQAMITGLVPDKRKNALVRWGHRVVCHWVKTPRHDSSTDMGVFCESTYLQQQQLKNTFPAVHLYLDSGQVGYFWCSPSDNIMSLLQVHKAVLHPNCSDREGAWCTPSSTCVIPFCSQLPCFTW